MKLSNTPINMVQTVLNAIDSYSMGSLRALAQEPVQNAMDAVRAGQSKVTVEYRLIRRELPDGSTCFLLSITDSGTTGLRGPVYNQEQMAERGHKLLPEENWAAFEAQGWTKQATDALGSRGQGKNAFLYHSYVPGESRRMLMVYDTKLEDGVYRLGMRFALPNDLTRDPPLLNNEAKSTIAKYSVPVPGDITVPLGLEPLRHIGTRVIVPFLSEEDVPNLMPGGELSRWLQRCWWRAIQIGNLHIRVVDNETGEVEQITVPGWWRELRPENQPSSVGRRLDFPEDGQTFVWSNLAFGDGHMIRRLYLSYSESLVEDEIERGDPEFAGIQVLRGSQWIETLGSRELGDYIPRDKRAGFRGFVEFDKLTDRCLRITENSQHDGFIARGKKGEVIRELRIKLEDCTSEFCAEVGWESATTVTPQQLSKREQSTHEHFMNTFLVSNGRNPSPSPKPGPTGEQPLHWDCRLDLEYPDPDTARVKWGQSLRQVRVEVGVESGDRLIDNANLLMEWVDDRGNVDKTLYENAIGFLWSKERVQQQLELGDWKILRGKVSQAQQIHCPVPGEYRLRAVVEYRGTRVKSASETVYVQTEPPPPPQRNPVTLSISAVNISVREKRSRIDHGEELQIQINVRNRGTQPGKFQLTANFNGVGLASNKPIELAGTPAGSSSRPKSILTPVLQLLDPRQTVPLETVGTRSMCMPDSSGRYRITADLVDVSGDHVINDSAIVYFQRDPGNTQNNLPFRIEQQSQKAMWLMNKDLDRLTYPADYPLYREMKDIKHQRSALQGRLAFIAEISANGLLEWALRPIEEEGSDSNYVQLYNESRSLDDELWDHFNRGLEKLSKSVDSPTEYAKAWRETVATMLDIFAREHNS